MCWSGVSFLSTCTRGSNIVANLKVDEPDIYAHFDVYSPHALVAEMQAAIDAVPGEQQDAVDVLASILCDTGLSASVRRRCVH